MENEGRPTLKLRSSNNGRIRLQSPKSFSHHESYLVEIGRKECFGRWVKFKNEGKKRIKLHKRKADNYFLVCTILKELIFYEDDSRKRVAKEFNIMGGSFMIRSIKSRKIKVSAFDVSDRRKKKVSVKLQMLNKFDFDDLIRYFKEKEVLEKNEKENSNVFGSMLEGSFGNNFDFMGEEFGEEVLEEEEEEEGEEEPTSLSSTSIDDDFGTPHDDFEPLLSKDMIEKWDTGDVLQWSKGILVGTMFMSTLHAHAEEYILESKMTGKAILGWSDEQIIEFTKRFKLLLKDRKRVERQLRNMRDSKFHECGEDDVLGKIVKMLRDKETNTVNRSHVFRLQKALGDKKLLKKTMLGLLYGTNWKKMMKRPKVFNVKVNIVENLREERQKRIRKVIGRFLELKDFATTVNQKVVTPFEKWVGDDEGTKFGIFHVSLSIGNLQLEWVDAELVITRPVSSEKVILCSDVGTIHVENGGVFTAKLAEEIAFWNMHNKYKARGAGGDMGQVAAPKAYSPITPQAEGDAEKFGFNCQHFVHRMLEYLQIDWELPTRVQKFVNKMKYAGRAEKVFHMDKKFVDTIFPKKKKKAAPGGGGGLLSLRLRRNSSEKGGMNKKLKKAALKRHVSFGAIVYEKRKQKKKEKEEEEEEEEDNKNNKDGIDIAQIRKTKEFRPSTHKELDLFVQAIFRACPTFERDFNGDYLLLKGFDRAFWLTYRSEMNRKERNEIVLKRCQPDSRPNDDGNVGETYWRTCGCPFTKPKET